MKVKIILSISTLLFLISCGQNTQVVKQFTQDALMAEIVKMNDISSKAMIEGDYESTLKNYTKDAISLPSYQPMVKGIEGLKKMAEMQKEMPMKMKKFVLTSTDTWQDGKTVIDIGTYDFVMDMPQMPGGEFTDKGKYLTIYEVQVDGSLLIKAETWNTDSNPWMQMSGGY